MRRTSGCLPRSPECGTTPARAGLLIRTLSACLREAAKCRRVVQRWANCAQSQPRQRQRRGFPVERPVRIRRAAAAVLRCHTVTLRCASARTCATQRRAGSRPARADSCRGRVVDLASQRRARACPSPIPASGAAAGRSEIFAAEVDTGRSAAFTGGSASAATTTPETRSQADHPPRARRRRLLRLARRRPALPVGVDRPRRRAAAARHTGDRSALGRPRLPHTRPSAGPGERVRQRRRSSCLRRHLLAKTSNR